MKVEITLANGEHVTGELSLAQVEHAHSRSTIQVLGPEIADLTVGVVTSRTFCVQVDGSTDPDADPTWVDMGCYWVDENALTEAERLRSAYVARKVRVIRRTVSEEEVV